MCYTKKIVGPWIPTQGTTENVHVQVQVPAESIWFDGHFPGRPILPGVAQLAIVVDVLAEVLGQPVFATHVSRVRFKQAIEPDVPISVVIESKKNDPMAYGFRISNDTELACSGFIKVSRPTKTDRKVIEDSNC